ncbi:MAG: helicase, partial [Oscillospiraceae bacterium]|nr:helicase [Oscillospiraceae bacterium]
TVIQAIYAALENLGFRGGNILEPSCGVGNFFGLLPESMQDSRLYGVELDPITGRIARQLYQTAAVAVQGFEKTDLPDSFFDAAVGNVPFGNYKVSDRRYDKLGFSIHNYFFAKTLDKVRPGGIVAFVTSRYTLDAKNPAARRYLAQRADLLGAVRLPSSAFQANAGTKVVTDILFLQKREKLSLEEPDWVHLGQTADGFAVNSYFADHPEMMLGVPSAENTQYGREDFTLLPMEGADLGEQLAAAVQNIQGFITEREIDDPEAEEIDRSIPADPTVRNFSFTEVDSALYYRENSRMNPVDVPAKAGARIRGMIGLRDCVRTMIEYQLEDYSDQDIRAEQAKLNQLYDEFVKQHGRIYERGNKSAFSADSSYYLLCSLEVLKDGKFLRKADLFTKRTIRRREAVTHVDTASEALAVSLGERAKVDMPFMAELAGKTEQEIFADLRGVIFLNPMHGYGGSAEEKYLPADEYLSGKVREKLACARRSAEVYPEDYAVNVRALEQVQPKDLTAGEISVRLGAAWLPEDVVQQFMFELLDTPAYGRQKIRVHYSAYTGAWNVEGKSADRGNVKAVTAYGTGRVNAYKIMEDTLNLRDTRVFDYHADANGRRVAVLNRKETTIAQGKQMLMKQAFQDWIWKDPDRRERLCRLYNDRFNSVRPREYDGSHLRFVGMNPEITLRPHQLSAIAHVLYGGNTLLGHVVGAGKTWEMTAAAQES